MPLKSLILLGLVFPGQTTQPSVDDPRLGPAFVDGSFGFSLRSPKGWRIARQRVQEGKAVVLLRMSEQVSPGVAHEIALKQRGTAKEMKMEALLEQQRDNLAVAYNNPKIESQQAQPIAGRPGGLLAAVVKSEGTDVLLLQAFIELRPMRYYVLMYRGPVSVRKDGEPLFHLVLGSLALLDDKIDVEQAKKAVRAAEAWLSDLQGDDVHKILSPNAWFQYEMDGKVVGFVRVTEREGKDEQGRSGIVVRERAWTFGEDGLARRTQHNMFLSDDLKHETWKTSITTSKPGQEGKPGWTDVALQNGVRTNDVLLSDQTYDLSRPATENAPLRLLPSYVARPLIRMVPRLMKDLSKPRMYIFATFDHGRTGLAVHTVELKGAAELPDDRSQKAFRIDEREGLAGEAARLYVDEHGALLRAETSDVVMRPAGRVEMQRQFASRIAAAEKAMAEYERGYRANEDRFHRDRKPPAPPGRN